MVQSGDWNCRAGQSDRAMQFNSRNSGFATRQGSKAQSSDLLGPEVSAYGPKPQTRSLVSNLSAPGDLGSIVIDASQWRIAK